MARKGKIVLCDTSILVEVLNQNTTIIAHLQAIQEENIAINPIIKAELLVGAKNKEEFLLLKNALRKYQYYLLDKAVSKKFDELIASYALSHRLKSPDALIASTAIINSLPLYTLNVADFVFIEELELYQV
jgi:tRNA(fMet)-specific endonuclease VapC